MRVIRAGNEPRPKDAPYGETRQTTGRTTRILNRPKRVCVDVHSFVPPRGWRFSRQGGIYRSDAVNLGAGAASRWSAPSPSPKRDGRNFALTPSSAMSSGRLFLDRVARQQSPSPLHRRGERNIDSSDRLAKGDISTLPGGRHFYFALTRGTSRLTAKFCSGTVTAILSSCPTESDI